MARYIFLAKQFKRFTDPFEVQPPKGVMATPTRPVKYRFYVRVTDIPDISRWAQINEEPEMSLEQYNMTREALEEDNRMFHIK